MGSVVSMVSMVSMKGSYLVIPFFIWFPRATTEDDGQHEMLNHGLKLQANFETNH